jgi:hypothetical protein
MYYRVISVAPTIDTAIYAAGDQLGGLMTLSNATMEDGGNAILRNLIIIDKDKEKAVIDVLFFSADPTVASSDNAALNISDANMATYFLGKVSVAAADYTDLSASSVASVTSTGLILQAAAGSRSVYAIMKVLSGTPTFTATNDLQIKFGLEQG